MNNKEKKKLSKAERKAYALVGRHGGRATFKKHGKSHMSEIGKIGAKKRWSKKSAESSESN